MKTPPPRHEAPAHDAPAHDAPAHDAPAHDAPAHDAPAHDAPAHDAPETIEVTQTRVSCDGGGGALGHPKVYLTLSKEGWVDCPYCDRRFVLKEGAAPADRH